MPTITLLKRTTHNTATIRYTPNPNSNLFQTNPSHSSLDISAIPSTRPHNTTFPYDSDNEPLLQNTRLTPLLLTTTKSNSSSSPDHRNQHQDSKLPLASLVHHSLLAPPLLPLQKPTSESIIPAIITNVIPSPHLHPAKPKPKHRQLLGKFKKDEDAGKGITKVAFMPRKEYLRFFARGTDGKYIGTEPYRRWSEEELEREFGGYRPACLRKGGGRR